LFSAFEGRKKIKRRSCYVPDRRETRGGCRDVKRAGKGTMGRAPVFKGAAMTIRGEKKDAKGISRRRNGRGAMFKKD